MDPRTEKCKLQYEGKHYFTKDGEQEFVITNFNSAADVTVEFISSGLIKKTSMGNINMGLANPFTNNACIVFDTLEHELVGNIYKTNQGYYIKIIAAKSKAQVMYQFMDQYQYTGVTTIQNIRNGQVRNPYHMNEFGGYMGVTKYCGNKFSDLYNIWHCMLVRGTGGKQKYVGKGYYQPIGDYDKTAICQSWRCYANFADWYMAEISKLNPKYAYELDKDLLYHYYKNYTNGYKVYSPSTCVLIPHDLNLQLQNYNRPGYDKDSIRDSIIYMTDKYYNDWAMTGNTYNAIKSLFYKDGTRRTYSYTPSQKECFDNLYTNNVIPDDGVRRNPIVKNKN